MHRSTRSNDFRRKGRVYVICINQVERGKPVPSHKRDGTKEHVWRCINRLECGKKYCKHSPSMKEPELQKMIMDMIRPMFTDSERVKAALKDVERKIALQAADQQNAAAVITRIQEIDQAMSNLLLLVSHSADSSIYDEKFKQLSKEKSDLQARLKVVEQAVQQDEERKRQLQTILDTNRAYCY